MTELVLSSAAMNVIWAITAFLIARLCLSFLDRQTGFNFKRWISGASDSSIALYLGFRILAVCILVGLIVQPPI